MAESKADVPDVVPAHSMEAEEVLEALSVDVDTGLSAADVEQRQATYGKNVLAKKEGTSMLALILEQFEDPLVITLLIAAAISASTNAYDVFYPAAGAEHISLWEAAVEPGVIIVILAFNAFIGVWQEMSAENALEALKSLQAEKAVVRREGEEVEIDASELVPGDILLVKVGDKVPADARVVKLETTTLRVEQASLTGESATSMKDADAVDDDVDVAGKHNMLFSSTGVVGGRAWAVCVSTGMSTELGKIQAAVTEADDDDEGTPLSRKIQVFSEQLQLIILVICVSVWVINFRGFFLDDGTFSFERCLYYLKIAVALAVAAIPEGLPAVITTCLALGTRRMAQQNAIVRRLPSVETLGCTTVICSDKTGTLTTNEMSVVQIVVLDEEGDIRSLDVDGTTYDPAQGGIPSLPDGVTSQDPALVSFAVVATLCNDARIVYADGKIKRMGEPTEAALKVAVEKMGIPDAGGPQAAGAGGANRASAVSDFFQATSERMALLEFSRSRKSMSVLVRPRIQSSGRSTRSSNNKFTNKLLVKGAPESIIARCTKVRLGDGRDVAMDDAMRERLLEQNASMADDALRCIAMATRDHDLPNQLEFYDGSATHPGHEALVDVNNYSAIESNLTFIGIAGIVDPPRPEVKDSIVMCAQAGIRVIVITGDNQHTAEAVSREIGIFGPNEDLTGKSFVARDFMAMSTAEQEHALLADNAGRVFSRAEPAHKQVIIRLLKAHDHVVAMTGDGVNDAPALKAADIGVAMGSGTEVARESGDLIIADDNLATITNAVREGRSIYSNTKAFIRYMISSNIGEVASIFITAALGLPEIMIPVQLLWINLVTDGPPATALGFNPPDADIMRKPPRRSDEQLISAWTLIRFLVVGAYVGFATVGIFVFYFTAYDDGEHSLVTFSQLTQWASCNSGLNDESSIFYKFDVPLSGGVDLRGNPCNYFDDGKIKAATMSLSVLVLIELFNALNAISSELSLFTMPPWVNPWLMLAVVGSFCTHCIILYVPVLADTFSICALSLEEWKWVLLFSFPVIPIDEMLKAYARCKSRSALAARMAALKKDE